LRQPVETGHSESKYDEMFLIRQLLADVQPGKQVFFPSESHWKCPWEQEFGAEQYTVQLDP